MRVLISAALALFLCPLSAHAEVGIASHYGRESGHTTANGEHFPSTERTCAHRRLTFGTRVVVTDLRTGRSIVCRVNDRGPYVKGRIIDLNPASAAALGILSSGTARVRITPEARKP